MHVLNDKMHIPALKMMLFVLHSDYGQQEQLQERIRYRLVKCHCLRINTSCLFMGGRGGLLFRKNYGQNHVPCLSTRSTVPVAIGR
jgi:hypothetical protein